MANEKKRFEQVRVRRTVLINVLVPLEGSPSWEEIERQAFAGATAWLLDGKRLPGVSAYGGEESFVDAHEEVELPDNTLEQRAPPPNERLVKFLYDLMTESLPVGAVETLAHAAQYYVSEAEKARDRVIHRNGHLADIARDLAGHLSPPADAVVPTRTKALDDFIKNLRTMAAGGYKSTDQEPGTLANFLEFCLGRRNST